MPAGRSRELFTTSSAATILREALEPYPKDLVIATKVGARRGPQGSWEPAFTAEELTSQVDDNLRNLGVDTLAVVNLRIMFHAQRPVEGSIEAPLSVLVKLQREGKIRHLGLSNATAKQVEEGRAMTEIVCVQNLYNLAYREDDALIDSLAEAGIAYVPFFPLGGFSPLQSSTLSDVSSVEHLRENLAAADLELSDDAMAALERL